MSRKESGKNESDETLASVPSPAEEQEGAEKDPSRKEKADSAEKKEELSGAFLVGVQDRDTPDSAVKEYVSELSELVKTLGIPVKGTLTAPLHAIHPKFYIGSGKLEEIRDKA
ncbi:MAG: hypothetical protein J6331_03130, partial [Lentisphaeria bacterium]|nr:hypothetical protein [Lentisphaeria bacterium]